MFEPHEEKLICPHCKNEINNGDDFCPECGTLFSENIKCTTHNDKNAAGACVICCQPYCSNCGIYINRIFLCDNHGEYEIYEGMARVFGSSDSLQIDYTKTCLEQEGLHPLVFSKKASPWHLGGTEYSLFRASGEFDGHLINEIKLMIPLQEVLRAEDILSEIDISKG